MTCKINRTYTVVSITLLTIFSVLPVFSACVSGPGDLPPTPCPDVDSATNIQGALNKTSMEVWQCCHNPNGSEGFSGQDWADYLGISLSSSSDIDLITPKKYVMVVDEDFNCSWELRDKPTQEVGDHVQTVWSGSVNYRIPGDYEIQCLLYNDQVKTDSHDCAITTADDPLTLTCVVTVKEVPPQQDPLYTPSSGYDIWTYSTVCYAPVYTSYRETGTISWEYCFDRVASTGIGGCGQDVGIGLEQTITVGAHGDISGTILEDISVTIGASLQVSYSITIQHSCSAVSCRKRRLNIYQRAILTERDVFVENMYGYMCTLVQNSYNTIIPVKIYEDVSQMQAICETMISAQPSDPSCLCPEE